MDYTYGYKIFLHERGQFWPGGDMSRLGQTESLYLNTRTLALAQFHLIRRRTLQSGVEPCQEEEEESYSFTRCLLQFVAGRVGCHLDWASSSRLPLYPPCESLEELLEYSELLEEIKGYSWVTITKETGCYRKCHYKEYKFNKV